MKKLLQQWPIFLAGLLLISGAGAATRVGNETGSVTIVPESPGLQGYFYLGTSFNSLISRRVDMTIDFDPADEAIGSERVGEGDFFSARWIGFVTPEFSETYTFYTYSDDGVRLFVDGQPIVDNWTEHGPEEDMGSIPLIAGHAYPIVLEFFEAGGGSTITLSWSSESTPKAIVPASALSHGGETTVNDSRNARMTDGLVGLWSFDGPDMDWIEGKALDRAGEHDGDLSGMSQRGSPVPGKIGQALSFDGATSCVETGLSLNGASEFTLAGWIYPHSYDFNGFFGQNDIIEFGFAGSERLQGWTQAGDTVNWNIDTSVLRLREWHHVAFTGSSESGRLYVDGDEVAASAVPVLDYGSSAYLFNIGGCGIWGATGNYFDGRMDDVRVYDRALPDSEIYRLYLLGR